MSKVAVCCGLPYSGRRRRLIVSLLIDSGLWQMPATPYLAFSGLAHVGQPEGPAELMPLRPQTMMVGHGKTDSSSLGWDVRGVVYTASWGFSVGLEPSLPTVGTCSITHPLFSSFPSASYFPFLPPVFPGTVSH